jgi:hypothetical protein
VRPPKPQGPTPSSVHMVSAHKIAEMERDLIDGRAERTAIVGKATKAKRDLTAKEKARVKSLDAEINSLEKNIPLGKKVKAAAEAQARNANSVTSAAAPPSGKRLQLELALNGVPTPVRVYADGRVVAEETGKGDPVYESWSQFWSDNDLEDEAVYEDVLDQIDDDVRGEAEEKEGVDRGGDPDEYLKACAKHAKDEE